MTDVLHPFSMVLPALVVDCLAPTVSRMTMALTQSSSKNVEGMMVFRDRSMMARATTSPTTLIWLTIVKREETRNSLPRGTTSA